MKTNVRDLPTPEPEGAPKAPRRQPVQTRSKATVARLLDTLGLHLKKFGFRSLNTNDIAAEAGVSVGTIYNYFPDIVAMVEAYAARSLNAWLTLWTSQPAFEPRADWRNSLVRSFRDTLRLARADYAYVLIVNAYGNVPEFEDTIVRVRKRQVEASIDIFLRADPQLSRHKAELLATVMLNVGWAAILHAARGTPNPELEAEYETMLIAYMEKYLDE